jgi:hypothetical protein
VDRPRLVFTARYTRSRIVGEMAQDVLSLLHQHDAGAATVRPMA